MQFLLIELEVMCIKWNGVSALFFPGLKRDTASVSLYLYAHQLCVMRATSELVRQADAVSLQEIAAALLTLVSYMTV